MRTSEQINEVAAALAKAQGDMQPALKDSENPHFRSKYADLAAVWQAWHAVGPTNGIATVQDVTTEERGVAVVTRLLHSSGQWLEFGPLTVPLAKFDAHGVGSATSYAKRYGLSAAVGVVAEEDDDGNAAANGAGRQPRGRVDRSDAAMAQRREESAASAPYAERPAHIDADGVVADPPKAAEIPPTSFEELMARRAKLPPELQAVIPEDEEMHVIPPPEAAGEVPFMVAAIVRVGKARGLAPKEWSDDMERFHGSRRLKLYATDGVNPNPRLNPYFVRAHYLYMDTLKDAK